MLFTEKNKFVIKIIFLLCVVIACQSFAACQSRKQKTAKSLESCQSFLDKDDLQSAGECFEKALTDYPERAKEISKAGEDAIFKKCNEYNEKENHRQAIVCYDAMLAFRPDSASVYYLLADSYFDYYKIQPIRARDLLEKAKETVLEGLNLQPLDADLLYLYGDVLNEEGDLTDAIIQYKKAVKNRPEIILYRIKLAMAQEKSGQLWDAVTSYNQALLIDPKKTLSLYNLGKVYEELGEIDKAIFSYEKLLEIEDKFDDAQERLERLKKQREANKNSKAKGHGQGSGRRREY